MWSGREGRRVERKYPQVVISKRQKCPCLEEEAQSPSNEKLPIKNKNVLVVLGNLLGVWSYCL
jgi:hypothetical protein